MDFMNGIENQLSQRKTLTDNGAVAYETAGKALTDFAFAITAMRNMNDCEIQREFSKVFFEDKIAALRLLFMTRDCRGGNGERKIFRACMVWLAYNKPEIARAVIALVPEYGRWDDLWPLLYTQLRGRVIAVVKERLVKDYDRETSLLAKWMPSLNASSLETKKYAEILCDGLGMTPRNYRKMLSELRAKLDVVERKMSANEWEKIQYSHVPSRANLIYSDAFMRHDEGRRTKYLDSLKNGNEKINAQVLNPNDIIKSYTSYCSVNEYDETLEQLWRALPDLSLENTLVVRDGSGSMTVNSLSSSCPMYVATGLAIYMAEHSKGIWKNKYITFSADPNIVDLTECETLRDKILVSYDEDDWTNTDIYKTFRLILDTAIKGNCSQEDMPKNICIISDMQFDYCYRYQNDDSLFDNIAREFEMNGYLMPRVIFWNVAGQMNKTIPMQRNKLGVVLCSGFSVQLLKMIMSGKTDPYEVLLEAINAPRYDAIEDAVRGII